MPWEIFRTEVSSPLLDPKANSSEPPPSRIVDIYAKNGGIGAYNAEIVLSPDHGFGFNVLTAGPPPSPGRPDIRALTLQTIDQVLAQTFLAAFEAAGAEQAARNFAGTYSAASYTNDSSSSLTIVVGDGGLGMGVKNWTQGEKDLLKSYYAAWAMVTIEDMTVEPTLRLYPVDLQNSTQVAFRGVFEIPGTGDAFSSSGMPPFGTYCGSWATVSEPAYGNVGLEDFVFDVDEAGRATALTARGARKTLLRDS